MNVTRIKISACILAGILYVFNGITKEKDKKDSIESIDARSLVRRKRVQWKRIELGNQDMLSFPYVTPINDSQIIIFGWGIQPSNRCEVSIFDVESQSISTVSLQIEEEDED